MTLYVTGFEKRDHFDFAQNVKSCYEPVKFTCPLENVLELHLEPNEIIANSILDTKNSKFWSAPNGHIIICFCSVWKTHKIIQSSPNILNVLEPSSPSCLQV